MRLFEFEDSSDTTGAAHELAANLITVLNQIKGQYNNEDANPSISTPALINLVKNTGVQFDFRALLDLYKKNTAIQNLIKNVSKDTVDFVGAEADASDLPKGEDSGEAIAKIAKRVANRNIG